MEKRWVVKPIHDKQAVYELSHELGISNILARLLVLRGISTFQQSKDFFRPSSNQIHSPSLLKDMDLALSRIMRAIETEEKILIYGDYDVDGTTAVALLYQFIRNELGYKLLSYYIPDRYNEGYGVSKQGVKYAIESGYTLIITLDCGISDFNSIAIAKANRIDVIVADHHMPSTETPAALAIINPKQKDCSYPYKELSGCGLAFKIIQGLAQRYELPKESYLQYLQLVAISNACDIVEIKGENRTLASYGLRQLNESPNKGLRALIELFNVNNSPLSFEDVAFQIGPRINAAGRIAHAKLAVELLLSETATKGHEIANQLNDLNSERKTLDKSHTQEAITELSSAEGSPALNQHSVVVYNSSWHKGVIGIVASRLVEKYHRPTIVLTQSNGLLTGSARSVKGINIHQAISECQHLLKAYGGHQSAAGLSMFEDNLNHFQKHFDQTINQQTGGSPIIPELEIDAEVELSDISPKFIRILKQFEPFGPGNMQPVFITKNITEYAAWKITGNNHLKFIIKPSDSIIFDCIGFNLGDYVDLFLAGQSIDICYTIAEKCWNNKTFIQFFIKGIRPHNEDN